MQHQYHSDRFHNLGLEWCKRKFLIFIYKVENYEGKRFSTIIRDNRKKGSS